MHAQHARSLTHTRSCQEAEAAGGAAPTDAAVAHSPSGTQALFICLDTYCYHVARTRPMQAQYARSLTHMRSLSPRAAEAVDGAAPTDEALARVFIVLPRMHARTRPTRPTHARTHEAEALATVTHAHVPREHSNTVLTCAPVRSLMQRAERRSRRQRWLTAPTPRPQRQTRRRRRRTPRRRRPRTRTCTHLRRAQVLRTHTHARTLTASRTHTHTHTFTH